MKIVFLDIDGVLNSGAFFENADTGLRVGSGHIDGSRVELLSRLTSGPDVSIVISSAWRNCFPLSDIMGMLAEKGLVGKIIGATPSFSQVRGHEIHWWLYHSKSPVESFVILDDNDDMAHLKPRLVHTSWDVGLQEGDVKLAQEMLCRPFDLQKELLQFHI